MIEKIIFDYLKSELSVPVYMEYPAKNPPVEMVIIEKTGSDCSDHVFSAVIAIQSYAKTLYKTAELNEIVKSKMFDCIQIDKICKSDLNSDYNYPDVQRNLYRYQSVFDITYLE